MKVDTAVVNGTVVIPKLGIIIADLGIRNSKIVSIQGVGESMGAKDIIDASGLHILPGIIEPHCHLGYHHPLEDYLTETRAASLGGITTVLAFFRQAKGYHDLVPYHIKEASQRAYVDLGFHLGCLIDEHIDNINHYVTEFGVTSFKFYMGYKGVPEAKELGLIGCDDGYLFDGMSEISRHLGVSVRIHAENPEIVNRKTSQLMSQGAMNLPAWTDARPDYAEAENVMKAIYFSRLTRCPLYVVHVSCAEALRIIKEARGSLPFLYSETCPHYLALTCHDDVGNFGKVNPPLRDKKDCEALWQGINDGVIDTIGTDHAAITRDRKEGDIWQATPGVGQGMGTVLPIMLNEGVHKQRISLERLVELMAYNPARIDNLFPQKGTIAVGSDADLTIIDLQKERVVDSKDLGSAGDFSLYEGRKLKGWPVLTMVRGNVVMRDGEIVGKPGWGQYIRRR